MTPEQNEEVEHCLSGPEGGKPGRPSSYTQEVADTICERIADGESLRSICTEEGMPSKSSVFKWLATNEPFADQYTRAREAQADALFDEILHISNTPLMGVKTKTKEDGSIETQTGDMIEHRRLQVDARKWMAGKLRPKVYGDRLDLNHSGTIRDVDDEALECKLAQLLGKAGAAGDPRRERSAEED